MNAPDAALLVPRYRVAGRNRSAIKASPLPAMPSSRRILLLGLLTALGGVLSAGDASVAASATTGGDYTRILDGKGVPQPESYVFGEGRFFSGTTHDNSLAKMTFAQLARTLAPSLAKQNYFPAADAASARLLIVVHWGTTEIYEDPLREINQQNLNDSLQAYNASIDATGKADPGALNMALADRDSTQASARAAINRNAVLLGYARFLEKERREFMPTTAEITMSNELNEERYFVILMAYDNQARAKDQKLKPLWITRLSVRSPGNNFTEALPALAKVGADVFGQQHDDLVRVRTPMNRGSVKLGELEVLGTANDKAPAAKK